MLFGIALYCAHDALWPQWQSGSAHVVIAFLGALFEKGHCTLYISCHAHEIKAPPCIAYGFNFYVPVESSALRASLYLLLVLHMWV